MMMRGMMMAMTNLMNRKLTTFKGSSLSNRINDFDSVFTIRFSEGQDCHLGIRSGETYKEVSNRLRSFANMIDEAFDA